jgi:NADP-dependent 3-hydroxy acid dehydrogenase YdfG
MQTVLITGAGWQCVLVDHNEQALKQVGQSLPSPASAAHVLRTIDLTDPGQVASLGDGCSGQVILDTSIGGLSCRFMLKGIG